MERNSDYVCLSAVTIAEIEGGIAKARREGGTRKAVALAEWLGLVTYLYNDRILPFDLPAARVAGGLIDIARRKGRAPGFADIAIAATAHANGLTLLTRNIKDFAPLEIAVHDPFLSGPPLA
jgi:predicted nucleic acid-binding protein